MSFVYYQIKDMKHEGYNIYYKTPVNAGIHKATVFDDKYTYYVRSTLSNNMRPLGKFKYYSKRSSMQRWNDYDYEVIEFTNDYVDLDERNHVFCEVIPESGEHMIHVESLLYKGYEVYYMDI